MISFRLTGTADPDVLVISFHGATNRQKIALPRFQAAPDAGSKSACLQICDPTLNVHEALRLGWYSGSDTFPLRSILEELLANTISRLAPRRVVFFGSSGGGYAALLYARSVEGAISLTINPQTNILSYYPGHVDDYFAACWPQVPEAERARHLVCDLATLYKENSQNVTTVMLSSAGDRQHFINHVSRFVGRVGLRSRSRIILASDYYGVMGHDGSIPSNVIKRWFNAVLTAASTDPESILMAYSGGVASAVSKSPSRRLSALPQGNPTVDPQDLRLADLLSDYQLRQPLDE